MSLYWHEFSLMCLAMWPNLSHAPVQAAFLYINCNFALHPEETLQKHLDTWAEWQSSVLRLHCTYMVRLWRKTKFRSKPLILKLVRYHSATVSYTSKILTGHPSILVQTRSDVIQQLKNILNEKYQIEKPPSTDPYLE